MEQSRRQTGEGGRAWRGRAGPWKLRTPDFNMRRSVWRQKLECSINLMAQNEVTD
jgi:hypothetical protein